MAKGIQSFSRIHIEIANRQKVFAILISPLVNTYPRRRSSRNSVAFSLTS